MTPSKRMDCTNDVVLQMNPQMTRLICTTHPERLGTHQWSWFPESELSLEWTKGSKHKHKPCWWNFTSCVFFCLSHLGALQVCTRSWEKKRTCCLYKEHTHTYIYNNATYCTLQRNIYLSITILIYLTQYLSIYLSILNNNIGTVTTILAEMT